MNAARPYIENITFTSSQRGWRYDRLNQGVFFVSIAGGIFFANAVQLGEFRWDTLIIFALVWTVMSWLMRGANRRRIFGTQVNVQEDHLDVVDDGKTSCIPWKEILYIRIDRSPSGHRRNIRIRARGGKLFTLLDPEDGALLESWALEMEKAEGIKVKVRRWVTLNAEPVWTFLMCLLAMVLTHYAIMRELI